MNQFLLICLGGAVGTGLRYLIGAGIKWFWAPSLSFATLLVNVIGSALMGLLLGLGWTASESSLDLPLILGTGFLGGFTTYSAFNQETLNSLQQGDVLKAGLNVLVTVGSCLVASSAGGILAKKFSGG